MVQEIDTVTRQDHKGGYRQINNSLNICAFDDYLKGQTANLPQLANVEQITPGVLRYEVLRKLAGDCKVAFEMKGGKRKRYSVAAVQQ
ncbi:hypothetical protein V1515DRAFT_594998 [Lipomyces mesembrius]